MTDYKDLTYKLVRKFEKEGQKEIAKYILLIYLELESLKEKINNLKNSI